MRRFLPVLAMLSLPVVAAAQTGDPRDFRNLSPEMVAATLLPPDQPPVARVRFVELPGLDMISRVQLYTRPHVAAPDFCGQRILSLAITPIPADPAVLVDKIPSRTGDVEDVATYRHGNDCAGDGMFFHIYATSAATAFADVRRLAALIDRARANPDAPLPFPNDCVQELVPSCSAAAMLAQLSTGDIRLVATRRGDDLRFGLPLEDRARRGEGRLVEIHLEQDVMHYTVRMLVRGDTVRALHISGGVPIY